MHIIMLDSRVLTLSVVTVMEVLQKLPSEVIEWVPKDTSEVILLLIHLHVQCWDTKTAQSQHTVLIWDIFCLLSIHLSG